MKDTVTIYVCECGLEFDDSWAASMHYALNYHRSGASKELTKEEYTTWQQARGK